ncbi:MauE/DoxX family redox-associated membrane protein [Pedobacter caeni]|uniref:Methylamine utilisation protein MauE n=1 Tax=Pedobacter caeni TaxID=288992 RepID=A0A1M5LIU4_9SPHI|nr:MauE/DoxX family redox-associated membrane protein [Pedobacter caeni]SHG64876.1 Methylamine utilisation protein MauE [Pedobacter caeni]
MDIIPAIILLITAILILLWAYSSISKFRDLSRFRRGLKNQVFPKWMGEILFWTLPVTELMLIMLLWLPDTRLLGMYISAFLMLSFTIYVGGAVYGFYDRYPCPCGGIFRGMRWNTHLKVNFILSCIAISGLLLMEFGTN